MSENYNSMYWIRKRVEHEELAEALRAAERRREAAERKRAARARATLETALEGERDGI